MTPKEQPQNENERITCCKKCYSNNTQVCDNVSCECHKPQNECAIFVYDKDWEERFIDISYGRGLSPETLELFVNFIRTERSLLLEDLVKKLEGEKKEDIEEGSEFATPRDYRKMGFNQALETAIKIIKEKI